MEHLLQNCRSRILFSTYIWHRPYYRRCLELYPRGWDQLENFIWRHQMETFPRLTRSFDVCCDLRLNTRLSKQSRRRWFETPSRSLWRHCNVNYFDNTILSTQSPQFIACICLYMLHFVRQTRMVMKKIHEFHLHHHNWFSLGKVEPNMFKNVILCEHYIVFCAQFHP